MNISDVNDVNIDICDQTASFINNQVLPVFNPLFHDLMNSVTRANSIIRDGVINASKGIDIITNVGTRAINTGVNTLNDSTKTINNLLVTISSIFNVNSFFDFLRLIISLMIISVVPSNQINNLSFYVTIILYSLIFIIFVFPVLFIFFILI